MQFSSLFLENSACIFWSSWRLLATTTRNHASFFLSDHKSPSVRASQSRCLYPRVQSECAKLEILFFFFYNFFFNVVWFFTFQVLWLKWSLCFYLLWLWLLIWLFLLVICCPNVDRKVRLKTKPNVRKKQEVIPAEVFLFSQDAYQLCRSKHIKHICLSPLRCYSLSYSPSVSITITRTCPVVQIS